MIYSIENKYLKISASTDGAQLQSVFSKISNTEYLWQGDPAYWKGRAYNLFPFIGRMFENTYYYDQKPFSVRPHGLARYYEFSLETKTASKLVFLLTDNEETLKEYPFRFEYRVTFTLKDNTLTTAYSVKNNDDKELICAFGGHPGINVPFDGGQFEEYYLEFSEKTAVRRHLFSASDRFTANDYRLYTLKDGVILPLRHDLFDHDAVILANTSRCVSLKSKQTSKYVTMKYDDFKYIGFWHSCKTDAPFVCLEPWSALPATDGVCDVLETKRDMTRVPVGKTYTTSFQLEIHE